MTWTVLAVLGGAVLVCAVIVTAGVVLSHGLVDAEDRAAWEDDQ